MTAATIQASGFKKGMNKIVLDVPALLIPVAAFWGKASGVWNDRLGGIEQLAKARGLNIRMPRTGFYMDANGNFSFTKKAGYQYIQRKYYNSQLRKFVIWVEVL